MPVEPNPQRSRTFGEMGFDAFYNHNLPIVYGYALRLCGGHVDRAQDLAQEAWVAFVEEVHAGRADRLDVRWLVTVARNRFVDQYRRARRLESKLGLVWSARPETDCDDSVTRQQVLDGLVGLEEEHRLVLALRYIDGLPVDEIAETIARTVTATYSLLARARDELRRKVAGPVLGGMA